MQSATVAVETVTANVNERRFLGHLQTMFSTTNAFLSELMQNARRAGSPQVRFDFDKDSNTLEVTDSGCGIESFQTLISVAESGWSESVIEDDRPFGMGFAAVVFAAKQGLEVASRGKQIVFDATDIVEKRPIPISLSDFIGGTRVRIKGMFLDAQNAEQSLRKMAEGFAIEVYWNGEALPRPREQAVLNGVMTSVGFIHIPAIHDPVVARNVLKSSRGEVFAAVTATQRLFLQGLPCGQRLSCESLSPIVHLDGKQFIPRMPDRDVLIDHEAAQARIAEEIAAVWTRFLEGEKQRLSGREFADQYWLVAMQVKGAFSLMNDVDWIPACALERVNDYPVIPASSETYVAYAASGVSRDQIESGVVTLFDDDIDEEDEGDHFAKLLWALKSNAVFLSHHLPKGHWATSRVISFAEAPVEIHREEIARSGWSGRYAAGTVVLVKDLRVTMFGQTHQLAEAFALRNELYSSWSCEFVVPAESEPSAWVLRQASNYTDGNESYAETEHDLDIDEFKAVISVLKGEPPEVTIKRLLKDASLFGNLKGRSFVLSFDEDGTATAIPQ